jgi:hypothetical protein
MKSTPGLGEKSQVPHHRLVLGGIQGVGIVTCSLLSNGTPIQSLPIC